MIAISSKNPDRAATEAEPSETEIEITPEMISAAAEILWRDPFFMISPTVGEQMALAMLEAAFAVRCKKNDEGGHSRA